MPSSAQIGAVRTLIEMAPDSALRSLATALAGVRDGPMTQIRDMVTDETRDRGLRNAVFAPLTPLFVATTDPLAGPRFPRRLYGLLWTELKRRRAALVHEAETEKDDWRVGDDREPPVFDALCVAAAAMLRLEPQAFFREGDQAAPAEQLAQVFDLAPICRVALARLPEWLGKATDERVAAMKLLFKDATEIAPDATPRLLEMILAHLPEPQAILRLISTLTDRATDRYLASSELASFGVRLLDDTDRRIAAVKTFDAAGGVAAAHAAARDLGVACAVLAELEQDVELSRDGPWGARVGAARKALALSVETRLRDVDGLVAQALPLQQVRIAGRMTRPAPKVAEEPDANHVDRARAMVVFLDATRGAAAAGGYGALRNAVADKLTERLNVYADEVLHLINAGEAPDNDRALAYLEIAAEFITCAKDKNAAAVIRRRAAVAGERQPSQDVA